MNPERLADQLSLAHEMFRQMAGVLGDPRVVTPTHAGNISEALIVAMMEVAAA